MAYNFCNCLGCKMGGRCEGDLFVSRDMNPVEWVSDNTGPMGVVFPAQKDMSDPPKWNEFLDLIKGQKGYPSE